MQTYVTASYRFGDHGDGDLLKHPSAHQCSGNGSCRNKFQVAYLHPVAID